VRSIRGDIVLDRSAWQLPPSTPADFDGEPSKPYNVQPDVLLLNFKTLTLHFSPQPDQGVARVSAEPLLAGVSLPETVPLSRAPAATGAPACSPTGATPRASACRAAWGRLRREGLAGGLCRPGALQRAADRPALAGDGRPLDGQVKEGTVPAQADPTWQESSPRWPRWCATSTSSATT
jgi:D-alanyl-D-alanine carboxypeptidase/D-alanyl-D-alanine-endopeptidase (penicillin-binding protein 4)